MDPLFGLIVSSATAVIVSCACSLIEAVYYSVPMSHVRVKAQAGGVWALLLRLKEDPDRPIAGLLITNTLAHTYGAVLAGYYAAQIFQSWGAFVFSAFLMLAILWIGEIAPKTIGVIYARGLAPLTAWPLRILVIVWHPVLLVNEYLMAVFKSRGDAIPTITELELASLAHQGAREGEIHGHEARLIEQVLRLDSARARELMTPRTVVDMLSDSLTLAEARELARHWKHSRMPVYRDDNPEDVYGVCRRRDIFEALIRGDAPERVIAEFTEPIAIVPEGASAHLLLDRFINSRSHISAVIDEFGAFLGIVTLEDVIECLLGQEIVDEYDVHADMQRFALDQARRRGLPVVESPPQPPSLRDAEEENVEKG